MTPCPRPLPSPPCFSTISSDAFASGLRERAVRSGFRPVNPFFAFWGSGMCFLVVFLVMARRMRFARLPDAAVWSAAWFCAAALCRGSVRRRQGVCYVGFCSVYCERLKEHGRVADVERIRRFGSFFLSVAQVRVRGGRASDRFPRRRRQRCGVGCSVRCRRLRARSPLVTVAAHLRDEDAPVRGCNGAIPLHGAWEASAIELAFRGRAISSSSPVFHGVCVNGVRRSAKEDPFVCRGALPDVPCVLKRCYAVRNRSSHRGMLVDFVLNDEVGPCWWTRSMRSRARDPEEDCAVC